MAGLSRSNALCVVFLSVVGGACSDVQTVTPAPVGCANNFDCEPTEYCVAETCGGSGTCMARPTECPLNVSFVCGCDGNTYDNACSASKEGVRIAAEGECECSTNEDCTDGDYCEGESCSGGGTCEAKPTDCPVIFDPVCGCDGETYDSECNAESLGVRIASAGACPCADDDVNCCDDNTDCAANEYCDAPTCGGSGTCEVRPGACLNVFDPVCGCDGVTYNNACLAASNGVRVDAPGMCP